MSLRPSRYSLRPSNLGPSSMCSSIGQLCPKLQAGSKVDPADELFDRKHEIILLDEMCVLEPHDMVVFLGPSSTGKTALFRSYCKGKPNAVHINCRSGGLTSPTALIYELLSLLLFKVNEVPAMDLNAGFTLLGLLMDAWKKSLDKDKLKPVIFIDQAQVLMRWKDTHPDELRRLLAFLVSITKENNCCHVLMATSDYDFPTWLREAVDPRYWRAEVIGDFREDLARTFLQLQLELLDSNVKVDDTTWAKVYQVCGGNAGTLISLASLFVSEYDGDWDEALEKVAEQELYRVQQLAVGGQGYSAAQFAAAVNTLLDPNIKYPAVDVRDMQEVLGRCRPDAPATKEDAIAAGKPVLHSLVQANVLCVRPKSPWAQDIPKSAFAGRRMVVTAASTTTLYCLQLLKDEWQQSQVAMETAAAAPPEAGPSKT